MILVFLLHALFALIFPFARIAVASSGPIFFTAVRMILSGLILVIYEYIQNNINFNNVKNNAVKLLSISIFNIFLTNVPEFWSLQFMYSGKASFIYSICPFISAIFAYFLFSEKLTAKKFMGMAIGSIGLIIVLSHQNISEQEIGGILCLSWPEIAMIIAALSTVYGWTVMRQLVQTNQVTPISANGITMLLGGIMALILSYFTEFSSIPVYNTQNFIFTLIAISLVSNIICYNLYSSLLKKYTSTLLSFAGFIEPFFASIYGKIFLNEPIHGYFILSCFIILIGLYLFYSEELRQGYIKKKP